MMKHNDLSLHSLNTVTIDHDKDIRMHDSDIDDMDNADIIDDELDQCYELDSNYGVQLMMEGESVIKDDENCINISVDSEGKKTK